MPEKIKGVKDVYVTDRQIIIIGTPYDEDHNCNQMGCKDSTHVIFRAEISNEKNS